MGYENAAKDLQKKYDLRNKTVIRKPTPNPQNKSQYSSQQKNPPRQPSIAQTQLPSKQQVDLQQKTHQPNEGDKVDNKEEEKKDVSNPTPIFILENELSKVKIPIPLTELARTQQYKNQILKWLKVSDDRGCSVTINLQDDSPAIMFGP